MEKRERAKPHSQLTVNEIVGSLSKLRDAVACE